MFTELKPHSEGEVFLSPKDGRSVRVTHSTEETAAGGPSTHLSTAPPFLPSTISLIMENTAIFLFRDAHVLNPPAALISDLLARVDSSAAL